MYSSVSAQQQQKFFVVIFFMIIATVAVTGTDHIVGANKGWNPGINYTLWANNHTFYVGDLISFRYVKTQYNVFEVNKTSYGNCTTEGAVGNWSSGKDFILLDNAKRYYFICGNGGCFSGMKVSVLVHPLNVTPPSSANRSHSHSDAAHLDRSFFSVAMAFGVVCLRLFGSGWI